MHVRVQLARDQEFCHMTKDEMSVAGRCSHWMNRLPALTTGRAACGGPGHERCFHSVSRSAFSVVRYKKNDATATSFEKGGMDCRTPRDAKTNLLDFLNKSDLRKRHQVATIPYFTSGSYLRVTRADPYAPSGTSSFVGICIAKSNKGLGTTFILRNVIDGMGVEMMYELYSPALKEIKVLKLERRRRAKLYYLRDKPPQFSTVNVKMEPVNNEKISIYRRRGELA